MIHLAYDGSINGDWVAWYAINLARHDTDHHLRVIYVNTDEVRADVVRAKAEDLARECADVGVEMSLDIVSSSGSSAEHRFRDLRAHVPARDLEGPETLLVCGARLKPGGAGYLAATVSAKLLSDKTFSVMAVRVAQPGLLGAPRRFLVPVAGDREGFLTAAEILKRFTPDVERVELLRVMMIKRQLFRRLHNRQAGKLRAKGWDSLNGLSVELADIIGLDHWKVDANVKVSDDWAQEVIIDANRHKSHLILMEASWRDLGAKFLYGNPIEVVLRDTPCDVAIYRGV